MRTISAVMALILVGGVTAASAQRARAPARPEVIPRNQEIFRAPPRSPAAPRSYATVRDRPAEGADGSAARNEAEGGRLAPS
jgi:hypothetical protein